MNQEKTIREKFEAAILDVLAGRPVLSKDGEPLLTADGRVAVAAAQSSDLAVVRAYLKDISKSEPDSDSDNLPKTGQPSALLQKYLDGKSLPFQSQSIQKTDPADFRSIN